MNGRKSQPEQRPPSSVPPPEVLVGRVVLERYRIDAELGSGGFGIVYRAFDQAALRPVALKVLREEYFGRKALRRRFAREAKALMTLTHPHIVSITDYGVEDSRPFLAMELLEGHALDREIKQRGPLPPARCQAVMADLLSGLQYMHARGIVHRDLKPANIFLQSQADGGLRPKLLDFGLAKFVVSDDRTEGMTLTRSGDVFGTPSYMPPEQLLSGGVDHRADIYAAGVVLFEMLTGRRPFLGQPHDVMRQVLVDKPPRVQEVMGEWAASAGLEAIIDRALAKEPAERFESAADFAAALSELREPLLLPARSGEHAGPPVSEPRAAASRGDSPLPRAGAAGAGRGLAAVAAAALRSVVVFGARTVSVLALATIVVAVVAIYVLSRGQPESRTLQASPASRQHRPSAASGGPEQRTATSGPRGGQAMATATVADQVTVPQAAVVEIADAGLDQAVASRPAATEQTLPPQETVEEPGAKTPPQQPDSLQPGPLPAKDPWKRRAPKALSSIRRALLKGWKGSERTLGTLRRYNRDHAEDPRGHLLLAMLYVNRSWDRDVVNQYAFAYGRDPRCRGDRRMLRDLIALVGSSVASEDAVRLISRAYGREALAAVARAKANAKEERMKHALTKLQERLQGVTLASKQKGDSL